MADPAPAETPGDRATPETTALLLATFAEFYRQEVGAEEDVHRTLPFFGTALGIVIGALAYAAGRLPSAAALAARPGWIAFGASAALLGLAVIEAALVLVWLARAIAPRDYQRIGPESVLRDRARALEAFYANQGVAGTREDAQVVEDLRRGLLDSYAVVTPVNRELNKRRHKYRAVASSHLVRSLIWALAATTVIFVTDKLGILPKVAP